MQWLGSLIFQRMLGRNSGFGLMLAMLALWVQILAGSVSTPHVMPDQFADALAASICHAEPAPASDQNAPGQHHTPDCALCPVCQIAAQAHLLIAPPTPILAAPLGLAIAAFLPNLAQSLRSQNIPASRARGPPAAL